MNHYLGRLCYFNEVKSDVYTVWAVLRGVQIIRYTFPINQLSKFTKVSLKKLTDEEAVVDLFVLPKSGGHYVFEQR